jgi:hypothetical protein
MGIIAAVLKILERDETIVTLMLIILLCYSWIFVLWPLDAKKQDNGHFESLPKGILPTKYRGAESTGILSNSHCDSIYIVLSIQYTGLPGVT